MPGSDDCRRKLYGKPYNSAGKTRHGAHCRTFQGPLIIEDLNPAHASIAAYKTSPSIITREDTGSARYDGTSSMIPLDIMFIDIKSAMGKPEAPMPAFRSSVTVYPLDSNKRLPASSEGPAKAF